jgi:hypothetical protein
MDVKVPCTLRAHLPYDLEFAFLLKLEVTSYQFDVLLLLCQTVGAGSFNILAKVPLAQASFVL